MKIPSRILFGPYVAGRSAYDNANEDNPFRIAAITVTMSRFGPSGSSKSANIALEQRRDDMARVMSEDFFEVSMV